MSLEALLACPRCHSPVTRTSDAYRCSPCGSAYPIREGTAVFLTDDIASKDMNVFWDTGWQKRVSEPGHVKLHQPDEELSQYAASAREFRVTNHPLLSALPKRPGETVLNVGCGLGEAPMFAYLGALDYIGVDFSFTAASKSGAIIRRLGSRGFTVNANAERLPILSNTIDIVYSHGVLHHTPSTERTLEEVLRVMKPGARGVIGLYSTYSPAFLLARFVGWMKSLQQGKGKEWFAFTERDWDTEGLQNPWTKTYCPSEIRDIFSRLPVQGLRITNQSFEWANSIPKLGKHLDRTAIGRALANRLQPRLGSMLLMTFRKSVTESPAKPR